LHDKNLLFIVQYLTILRLKLSYLSDLQQNN